MYEKCINPKELNKITNYEKYINNLYNIQKTKNILTIWIIYRKLTNV